MKSQARVEAGTNAQQDGHAKESTLSKFLTEKTGYKHVVDGSHTTKQDIICEELGRYYSQKSASGNHTQVHLTSTENWCNYFNIDGDLRTWFDKFFGAPFSGREGRLGSSDIPDHLNKLALDWFNDNKIDVFDVIVRHGAYKVGGDIEWDTSKPVNHVIWYNKKTDQIDREVTVEYLADLVRGGKWTLNETTLHFHDNTGNKIFHLQMKGSGRDKKTGKPTAQYNGVQFHIYKAC